MGLRGVAPNRVEGLSPPQNNPGMDAGRVCQKALHDAEPTKHTQPFIVGKGFGDRDREFSIFVKFNFPQNFGRTSCPADIFIYLTIFYDINQAFISSPKKRTAFSLQILIASSVGMPFISASFSAVLCVIELSQRLPLYGTGAI